MRRLAIKAIGLLLSASGLSCSMPVFAASGSSIKIGVLEDLPGHYAGEPHFRAVRVVFRQDGRNWRAYPSDCTDPQCLRTISADYPKTTTWTVGLSGRTLGRVTGRTPSDFEWYGDVGLQRLANIASTPRVGKRSMEFAGYSGEPIFRPLIASSGSYFADPDSWKPLALPKSMIRTLRQQFRQKFANVSNCRGPEESKVHPWRYSNADIAVWKSYVSKTGWALAALQLKGHRCDDDLDGPWESQWFVISPKGRPRFLEAGLNFLDAGDYAHAGRSALIFSIEGDNRGGYMIFYNDFSRRAVFQFSYH